MLALGLGTQEVIVQRHELFAACVGIQEDLMLCQLFAQLAHVHCNWVEKRLQMCVTHSKLNLSPFAFLLFRGVGGCLRSCNRRSHDAALELGQLGQSKHWMFFFCSLPWRVTCIHISNPFIVIDSPATLLALGPYVHAQLPRSDHEK